MSCKASEALKILHDTDLRTFSPDIRHGAQTLELSIFRAFASEARRRLSSAFLKDPTDEAFLLELYAIEHEAAELIRQAHTPNAITSFAAALIAEQATKAAVFIRKIFDAQ